MIDAPYCRLLGTHIRILEWYARDEVKKIRTLSIGRRWDDVSSPPSLGRPLGPLGWGLDASPSLGVFEGLKELIVHDLSFQSIPRTPEVIGPWKERAEKEMREELERAKEKQPAWTAGLPLLTVVCDF